MVLLLTIFGTLSEKVLKEDIQLSSLQTLRYYSAKANRFNLLSEDVELKGEFKINCDWDDKLKDFSSSQYKKKSKEIKGSFDKILEQNEHLKDKACIKSFQLKFEEACTKCSYLAIFQISEDVTQEELKNILTSAFEKREGNLLRLDIVEGSFSVSEQKR